MKQKVIKSVKLKPFFYFEVPSDELIYFRNWLLMASTWSEKGSAHCLEPSDTPSKPLLKSVGWNANANQKESASNPILQHVTAIHLTRERFFGELREEGQSEGSD